MTTTRQMGEFIKISPIHPVSVSPYHVSLLAPALPGYGFINYPKKYEEQQFSSRPAPGKAPAYPPRR